MANCLEGKGTKDSWLISKDNLARAQQQSITMGRKSSKCSKIPAWMNMELLPELKHRKKEEGAGSVGAHGAAESSNTKLSWS